MTLGPANTPHEEVAADLGPRHATVAMWEFDIATQCLTWDPQAAYLLGVGVNALPRNWYELAASVSTNDSAAVLAALRQLVDVGVGQAEIRVGPLTEPRHLSLRGKILDRDRDGRPTRAVGLLLDRTLEKSMQEQMLRLVMSDAARADFEVEMAQGLVGGQFQLYYQPVIALATGHVTGFEALARWNRPGHGVVGPDSFIPAAEASTSTLINDLGRWALREAACQLAAWSATGVAGGRRLRMAVNASGRHISSTDIVADVQAALTAAAIDPNQLELELTETALTDEASAGANLTRIRALGVTVAIDDFGTGHTSIGQLPHLPVDTLKIDRSFVAALDPRHRALVRLIIEAAHAFDLHVVAEGIEDHETLKGLAELGCDAIQGFLVARPMPADLVLNWLASWQPLTTAGRVFSNSAQCDQGLAGSPSAAR